MNIRDVMTSDIKTVSPSDKIQQAASFMLSADTGALPVVDGDKVVGMITDRDIAVRGVASGKGPDCQVCDVMSQDELVTARDTDDILAVAQRMNDKQVRRVPVLDMTDKLVGVVSLGDLSRNDQQSAADTALKGVSANGDQHRQG